MKIEKKKIIEELDRRMEILLHSLEYRRERQINDEYTRGKFNGYKNIKLWLLHGD
jgi:hypothetical protein